MRSRSLLLALLGLFIGADFVAAQQPGCPGVGRTELSKALGAPELAKWLTLEAATCDELLVSSEGVGFKLGPDTKPVYGGNRSEVAVDFPFREGDTVRYSWQMKLPSDFVGDPLNRWWLLAQWHDQPDKRVGETWANFKGAGSPPVALYVAQRDGVPGLGIVFYGNDKRSWVAVPLGVWLTVSVTTHWSTQADGMVSFHIDEIPDLDLQLPGRNMSNTYQHYLKFGQYRHSLNKIDSIVFYKNLKIRNATDID